MENYILDKKIYESNKTLIYSIFDKTSNEKKIIKILNKEYPTKYDIDKFLYEYNIGKFLNIEGIIKYYDLIKYKNSYAIIEEYFNGEPIKNLSSYSLKIILSILIDITKIISKLHNQEIIHKNINPSNILWNKIDNTVKIIDFGISERNISNKYLNIENVIEGTLAYISPEQTGKIDREISYTTDLYSLGITFYELLTGKLPFETDNPLEMIHWHIAKKPEELRKINPKIPKVLSDIVMKLLNKMPEDRYQSANGLLFDLKKCLEYFDKNTIKEFIIAKNDYSDKLIIKNKIYGREKEINLLLNSIKKLENTSSTIFVLGESGSGKTSLINNVLSKSLKKDTFILTGKFEQFKKNIPYFAITQILKKLLIDLSKLDQEQFNNLTISLKKELGDNLNYLIEILPELSKTFDIPTRINEDTKIDKNNILKYILKKFIDIITNFNLKLIIFLDDLQWADAASLNFIEILITEINKNLLFIGSYRNNEVNSIHYLNIILNNINKYNLNIKEIKLDKLKKNNIYEFISDNIYTSNKDKKNQLSKILYEKTEGNPFFLKEFIISLYNENDIYFNYDKYEWEYNLENITKKSITENILKILYKKMNRLNKKYFEILKYCAALGNEFEFNSLKALTNIHENELQEIMNFLIKEKFIILINVNQFNNIFKFSHDKIEQAIIDAMSENDLLEKHLQIAEYLINNFDIHNENIIFDIVFHYNKCFNIIKEDKKIKNILYYNYLAGERAIKSLAFDQAYIYFNFFYNNLNIYNIKSDSELLEKFYTKYIETLYYTKKYNELVKIFNIIDAYTDDFTKKLSAYEIYIDYLIAVNEYNKALEIALKFLEKFGINLSKNPLKITIITKLLILQNRIKKQDFNNLLHRKPVNDNKIKIILRITSNILGTAYVANPNLFILLVLTQIELTLKYGNSSSAPEAFSLFGLLLIGLFNNYDIGYKLGKLALNLIKNNNYSDYKGRVIFYNTNFILHWKENSIKNLKLIDDIYKISLETGDLEYAAWSIFLRGEYEFFSRGNINKAIIYFSDITEKTSKLNQIKQKIYSTIFLITTKYLLNIISYDEFNKKMFDILKGSEIENDKIAIYFVYYHLAVVNYLFEDYKKALTNINLAEKYLDSNMASMNYPMFYYFSSLIHLRAYKTNIKNSVIHKKIKKYLKQLSIYAKNSTDNYLHKYLIVKAEYYNYTNNKNAKDIYEEALFHVNHSENILDIAIINELIANYYFENKHYRISDIYLKDSFYNYDKIELNNKIELLERRFNQTFLKEHYDNIELNTTMNTVSFNNDTLDIDFLLKISKLFSSEIIFSKLLENIMKYLIETIGTEKGYILIKRNNEFYIEAKIDINYSDIELISIPLKEKLEENISYDIINYVLKTKNLFVFNEDNNEFDFVIDSYIKENLVKFLLCIPLINEGELIGLVYLENNVVVNKVSNIQIEILKMISSQLAVSIKNSIIYEKLNKLNRTLERKVFERTLSLDEKNKKLTDSINYSKKIQENVLPKESDIIKFTKDSMLIYLPKDVISGDFYWLKEIEEKKVFIVSDCTGHGVPGAFLSMIGSILLDKLLINNLLLNPSKILKQLDNDFKKYLKHNNTNKKFEQIDGMETAIVTLYQNKIYFSGAKRNIYILRKENNTWKLKEIKGNKFSIGGVHRKNEKIFNTIEFEVIKNDIIYMFSDGFVDQNNNKNEKYGINRFENLILNIADKDLAVQKTLILQELSTFMKDTSQRDDITILAFKI
ncbi:putative ATPase [Hypnocyclicus thermotrophus]|uniref:ATPase n=1 Tax=Hypnocyclicus thermotrophus TaxID=1627895 RepID=A0AA46E0H3_9FUSO|nr:AAA family ATPase [Hypnocyclicus thermotrophus]TDT72562.1 putative ATPase [Hypnocyclicus thermotrophus]